MFRIMRNIFKYGDAFFIRDPETKRWFYIDPVNVSRIIVNESQGKKPEQYIIRNMNCTVYIKLSLWIILINTNS